MQAVAAPFKAFFDFIDNRVVVRRAALGISVWLVWDGTRWAQKYAELHADKPGAEIALTITAVTGLTTLLMGYLFKVYTEDRAGNGNA